jgi:RNA polymerase sigma factor (sigma-70 family)
VNNINIADHLGLAHLACKSYKSHVGRSFDYDDLFQAACEGLMFAASKFDPARGKFSTYAVPMAKKYVKRLVATQARTVKCPQYIQDRAAKAGRAETSEPEKPRARRTAGGAFDWDAPGASMATGAAVHEQAEVWLGSYEGIPSSWQPRADLGVHAPGAEWSFDAPAGEEGAGTLHDVIHVGQCKTDCSDDALACAHWANPEQIAAAREMAAGNLSLQACLADLNENQRNVIRWRLAGWSQPRIALCLGVSKARVQQIQAEATKKLISLLADCESLPAPDGKLSPHADQL